MIGRHRATDRAGKATDPADMKHAEKHPEHGKKPGCAPAGGRVEISLGYACNNRCHFCSEETHRQAAREDTSSSEKPSDSGGVGRLGTREVKAELERFRAEGFDHLTFLGGEPTIRKDFPELVLSARRLGFRRILLTTNGRMLANRTFAELLFRAGLTHLYLSVHGPDAKTHDDAVQAPGAFDQVRQAMENLRELDRPFNISSVIYKGNVACLPDLARFLIDHGARRIFWAFVRPAGAAREHFEQLVPRFSELEAPLHEALAIAARRGAVLTVGHVPLCRLGEYVRFADELYWTDAAVQRELSARARPGEYIEKDRRELVTPGHNKVKAETCRECRYDRVCDGLHGEYARRRGLGELRPVAGTPVTDPALLRDAALADERMDR